MQLKNNIIYICLVLTITAIHSCRNEAPSPAPAQKKTSALIREQFDSPAKKKPISSKVIFEFIDYNDDGDYFLLNAKKGNTLYSFINDKNEDRSLLRGDLVEITWKSDTIYIAGDGETPELAEWITFIRKIRDGKVSNFRKQYPEKIPCSIIGNEDFSSGFKDKLYSLVEYYLANSTKQAVQEIILSKKTLSFSLEERNENGTEYIAIGIDAGRDRQAKTVQWLWYSPDADMLFEYDHNRNKLTPFK